MADPNSRPYHHGHLRDALVTAAMDLIADCGVEGLTIRALADRVGVSHAAPQHHCHFHKSCLYVATGGSGALEYYKDTTRILVGY